MRSAKRYINRQISLFSLKRRTGYVPLSWAATSSKCPYANLGDALSPIIVSALSGVPVIHEHFDAGVERLACVGTIGHWLKNGKVHLWGTGISSGKNSTDMNLGLYKRPPETEFQIHALRGPLSAQTFRDEGVEATDVYGDPVWFLPSIIPPAAEKKYELGVIVHLAELAELTDTGTVHERFVRYRIPESLRSDIRIITTITKPTFAALEERVQEITACKRIASTSLHGLVIAETYKIPYVYFRTSDGGTAFPELSDETEYINPRMRDFYAGLGLERLFSYGQHRHKATDWDDLIRSIDQHWSPVEWSPDAFLDAFPLPLMFNPLTDKLIGDRTLFNQIKL